MGRGETAPCSANLAERQGHWQCALGLATEEPPIWPGLDSPAPCVASLPLSTGLPRNGTGWASS